MVASLRGLIFGIPTLPNSNEFSPAPTAPVVYLTYELTGETLNYAFDRQVDVANNAAIDQTLCPTALVFDINGGELSSVNFTITDWQTGDTINMGDTPVAYPLNANKTTTVVAGDTTFSVAYVTSTGAFTATKSGGGNVPLVDATELLQSLNLENNEAVPGAGDRTVAFTVTDDSNRTSDASTLTINVFTPVVIDANGAGGGNNRTVTFTEGGSAVALLDAAGTVSAATSQITLAISGISSGTYERLTIDGVNFPLGTTATNTGLTEGATTFTAAVTATSSSTATVVLSKTGGGTMPAADAQALLRATTFESTVADPVEGNRVITFTPVDSLGNTGTTSTTTITVAQLAPTSVARTTAASGNWESTATWTGGVIPGANDTVTITHAVTLNSSRSVGHSPQMDDATAAIAINSGGDLTLATGATLTVRGDLSLRANGVELTLGAGSHIVFDPSNAVTPSTARYKLHISKSGLGVTTAQMLCNGTLVNPCSISTNTNGGANETAIITNDTATKGGKIKATYCQFTDLGDDAAYGIYTANQSDGDNIVSFENCTFTRTGGIYCEYSLQADDHFIFDNNTFVSSIAENNTTKTNHSRFFAFGAMTTGTRRMNGNVFDRKPMFTNWDDGTFDDNILLEGFATGGFNRNWASFDGNFYRWTSTDQPSFHGLPTNNYFAKMASVSDGNPAFINVVNTTGCEDCCFEDPTGNGYEGGGIRIVGNPSAPRTYTVTGNIGVYNANGSFGKLVGLHGGTNVTLVCDHNTTISGSSSGSNTDGHETGILSYGETYAGHAGMVSSFQGNLAYRLGSITNPGYLLQQEGQTTTPTDTVTTANYNGKWNVSAGSAGLNNGYYKRSMTAAMFTATTAGANDVSGDPAFLDYTRNLAKWDASLGGPGTAANAVTELAKKGTATYNSAYNVSDLITYVREGVRPTNSAFATAGPSGTVIGAMPYLDVSGAAPTAHDNTDLTQFTAWENNFETYVAHHGAIIAAQINDIPIDPPLARGYYDFTSVAYQGADYFSEPSYRTYGNAWFTVYKRFADASVTYEGNPGGVAGYWAFTEGARLKFEYDADTNASALVANVTNNAAFHNPATPLANTADASLSREVAYAVMNSCDLVAIGGATHVKLDDWMDQIYGTGGHMDQWFDSPPWDPVGGTGVGEEGNGFAPFMWALSCHAGIQYLDDIGADSRVLTQITRGANWVRSNCWSASESQHLYRVDYPSYVWAPDLELMIAPVYWWCWKQTGVSQYKTWGDASFNAGVAGAAIGGSYGKQFCQNYRWSFKGLLWRAQGNQAWGG